MRRVFKRKQSLWLLTSKEQWDLVRERLSTKSGKIQAITPNFSGMYLLHSAVSFNAPVDVVEKLIEISGPTALAAGGMFTKSLPIHMAATFGASPAVINVLLDAHPESARISDGEGRTPLHLVVGYACDVCDNDKNKDNTQHSSVLESLSALCRAAPECISVPDAVGERPIDIALWYGRKGPVATLLRDEVRRSMQRQSSSSCSGSGRRGSSLSAASSTEEESGDKQLDVTQLRELLEWTRSRSRRMEGPNVFRLPAA